MKASSIRPKLNHPMYLELRESERCIESRTAISGGCVLCFLRSCLCPTSHQCQGMLSVDRGCSNMAFPYRYLSKGIYCRHLQGNSSGPCDPPGLLFASLFVSPGGISPTGWLWLSVCLY